MKNILFLSEDTSCLGPITLGFSKKHLGYMAHFYAAGLQEKNLDAYAIQAMHDHEISLEKVKTLQEVAQQTVALPALDFVVLLSAGLPTQHTVFGNARVVQHVFDDPQSMVKGLQDSAAILRCYTECCAEIESFITELPKIYPEYF